MHRVILVGGKKEAYYMSDSNYCYYTIFFKSLAMKPYKEYSKTPSTYDCKYDSVSFMTSDNVKLAGWYIYSQLPDRKKPTTIFSSPVINQVTVKSIGWMRRSLKNYNRKRLNRKKIV